MPQLIPYCFLFALKAKHCTYDSICICIFTPDSFVFYRIVRLISPNLNYLIVTGAIMLYASVYFFMVSSTDELTVTISCHVSMQYSLPCMYQSYNAVCIVLSELVFYYIPSVKDVSFYGNNSLVIDRLDN